jgi:hypothetical protein
MEGVISMLVPSAGICLRLDFGLLCVFFCTAFLYALSIKNSNESRRVKKVAMLATEAHDPLEQKDF